MSIFKSTALNTDECLFGKLGVDTPMHPIPESIDRHKTVGNAVVLPQCTAGRMTYYCICNSASLGKDLTSRPTVGCQIHKLQCVLQILIQSLGLGSESTLGHALLSYYIFGPQFISGGRHHVETVS